MIEDAQDAETCHDVGVYSAEDPFHDYFVCVEDATGLGDLEIPKKSSNEASSSLKLTNRFSTPSVDPGRKRSIVISVPDDARASVFHHEAFLRSREELNRYEAEIRGLTEKKDAFKLLSEQREEEVKSLRNDLEASQEEHADLVEQVNRIFAVTEEKSSIVTNDLNPQVQQKIDIIGQLRKEVETIKTEAEEWKKNMDRLASEKETARAQLASTEVQLQNIKEKTLVQAKKIEELKSQLGFVISDREKLVAELEAAKSEVEATKANVDATVAVYRADAEAAQLRAKEVTEVAQVRANWVAKHAKCHLSSETLKEIHTRGFDLSTEIENARKLETEAKKLAYPDDDDESESLSESKSAKDSEGRDATLGDGDDQAT
ncbi:PREDICTED: uncharacterized protein LOC109232411 [Nicotiana attenuata]|uniref:uncharacterized protein LOC109232411 n=1 Tax=Nicotiana attenuata TaxID=49451 RepID=UPI0009051C78|nr:PREDICTED: uncharacterized protein LOC109232411 [Nicotiana attenuata]